MESGRLADQVSRLREHASAGTVAGIHLEGPYLNPRHGAQQAGYTATPDEATTVRFLDAAG